MEREIFLPDEVLIQTISHLKVPDVRSCRLVCRQWYSCCESRTITREEIFEFHSAMYPASEMNEFLINLRRKRVNVRLIKVDLKELNFEAFGRKIDELDLIKCSADVDTLRKLFYLTKNMTRLRVYLIPPHGRISPGIKDYHTWTTVINLLHKHQFQYPNLKQFVCGYLSSKHIMDKKHDERLILPRHVFFIFPCLQNITLWSTIKVIDDPELWSSLPKTNITHFGGTFKINFDAQQDHLETLASSFSRLKILDLSIKLLCEKRSAVSSCKRFFSHLTELEDLTLYCRLDQDPPWYYTRSYDPEYLHELAVQTSKVAWAVLFQILKSCLKLSKLKLRFQLIRDGHPDPDISFNPEEIREFFSLITKIKSLQFGRIFVLDSEEPIVTLRNTDGVLKEFVEKFGGPSDVHLITMNLYQLTTLNLNITRISSVMNFRTILQSLKCLQSLTICIEVPKSEIGVLEMESNKFIEWKHERLNHLKYKSVPMGTERQLNPFIMMLCSWEFPNLLTLQVKSETYFPPNPPQEPGNIFKKWIGRMTRLTQINVSLILNPSLGKFEDCVQVWQQMPRLEVIRWWAHENMRQPSRKEVIDLFDSFPNLRLISFGNPLEWFKYIRSKKQLFKHTKIPPYKDDIILVT